MKRREFISLFGSAAAAWPLAARAQQGALPVVGLIQTGEPDLIPSFIRGLAEAGFVEGTNVKIETRWALTQFERLPEFAADLVQRRVNVIATPGSTPAALAAKAATTTIPVVFGIGGDPVQVGLVASLSRPDGNITGYSEMNTEVGPKRLGLLHELVPAAARFGLLVGPQSRATDSDVRQAQEAAAAMARPIEVVIARTDDEIDSAFAGLAQKRIGALVVPPSAFFYPRRNRVIGLAARYAVPTVYWDRAFPHAGGLMSYGSSVADSFRQVGIYVGRVLKGEKPADMPVLQPTKFEFAINLKTAKELGLTVPPGVLGIADEVIE